jgi:hypothetical protein
MARLEDLAELYGQHISTPWQRTVAGAQRVIMVAYDKELERVLRARKGEFETRTKAAGHDWHEVDVTTAFAEWLAGQRYRDVVFRGARQDLGSKLQSEFPEFVAARIRVALAAASISADSVVAVFGVGSLYGFTHASEVLKLVERDVRGSPRRVLPWVLRAKQLPAARCPRRLELHGRPDLNPQRRGCSMKIKDDPSARSFHPSLGQPGSGAHW